MKIIWTRWHKYCNVTIVKMNCTRDQTWYVKLLFIHFWIHQIMSAWVCVCLITFSKIDLILAIMWDSGFLFQSWCFYNFLWSDCLVCVCASQAQMGRPVFFYNRCRNWYILQPDSVHACPQITFRVNIFMYLSFLMAESGSEIRAYFSIF